jgi:hypothetical protein
MLVVTGDAPTAYDETPGRHGEAGPCESAATGSRA